MVVYSVPATPLLSVAVADSIGKYFPAPSVMQSFPGTSSMPVPTMMNAASLHASSSVLAP
jgi:hypothetical protein